MIFDTRISDTGEDIREARLVLQYEDSHDVLKQICTPKDSYLNESLSSIWISGGKTLQCSIQSGTSEYARIENEDK